MKVSVLFLLPQHGNISGLKT